LLFLASWSVPGEKYTQPFPHPVRASSPCSKLRHRFFSLYIRLKNNHTSNKDKFSNIIISYHKLYNRVIELFF
jgi:hypothetical protein